MQGITTQEEVDALEQQLKAQPGVELRSVEKTRIVLAYDPEVATATELQGLIEFHVLAPGYGFDLRTKRPLPPPDAQHPALDR